MIGEYPKQIKIPLEEKYFRSSKKKDKNLEFFPFDNEKKENFNSFEEKKMSERRLICLWIDNQRKESTDLQINIGQMVHLFRYFNNIDQSIDYLINSNPNDQIIVIILQLIHSIYIYNPLSNPFKHSIDQYKKVQGIFSNIKTISEKIEETIIKRERKPLGITLFSSKDENRQDPSFMYSQLLKDLILNNYHYTESDQQTKSDMLNYCREISSDDENTQVNNFDLILN